MRVSIESIDAVTKEALRKHAVPEQTIDAVIEGFHYANQSGISTHGIRHLPMFIEKIEAGHLNPKAAVETVVDAAAVTVLDAHNTFGEAAAKLAIDIAIEKARKHGIAVVGVRNSNSFGAAGHFGYYAALEGMASIICANAAPAIAPTGGYKKIFGTNPICFAFPGGNDNKPIVLDMATTVAARSKIRMAAKNGEKIPMDWAVGPDGKPTDDPNKALEGSLLPIAGYKGYGLSLFIDLFAGLLTGSAFAGGVRPLTDLNADSKNGHFFIVIDVKRFMNEELLRTAVDEFCQLVRECGDPGSVMLPGEPGYLNMEKNKEAVELTVKELEDVNKMAERLGITARLEEDNCK